MSEPRQSSTPQELVATCEFAERPAALSQRISPPLVGCASLLLVIGLDVPYRHGLPTLIAGPVDWLAHAATTILFLLALLPGISRLFAVTALSSTVVIDLDHIPHMGATYLLGRQAPGHGQWLLHTFMVLVIVWLIAVCRTSLQRQVWFGVAFGLATHLFRNAASQEGIPAFLPLSVRRVSISYETYVFVLATLLAVLLRRESLRRRSIDQIPAGDP